MSEDHTAELKHSREEAERVAETLRSKGWEVYPEKVPLAGQWGYYCIRTSQNKKGDFHKRTHSVRWNLYDKELQPIVMNCQGDSDFLSFLWQHGGHEGFDFFEYGDGDAGFVCYCQGSHGRSLVLRIDVNAEMSQAAYDLLRWYETKEMSEDDLNPSGS